MQAGDKVIVRDAQWLSGTTYSVGVVEKLMPKTVKIRGSRSRYDYSDIAPYDAGAWNRLEATAEQIKDHKSQIADVQRRQRQYWDEARQVPAEASI